MVVGVEGGVTRVVAAGTYMGTDEIGFPMTGAGAGGTGEGGLMVMGGATFAGLLGLGGTTGGGVNLVWGLLILMLRVLLALAVVVWTAGVV